MNLDYLTQICIAIFGCSAIWFVGRPESWRRWGYWLGLCAQPFWVYTAIKHQTWGILFVTPLYAYSWLQGVWFNWIKPDAVVKNNNQRIKKLAAELGTSEKELHKQIIDKFFKDRFQG